jgi:hypothetical protein
MARDFEDMHSLDELDDAELRELVRERLADNGGVDVDNVTVRVRDGVVHLLGRVGTEEELRVAEHVLTDVVGVRQFENELVVDSLRRSEAEEAADDEAEAADHGTDILGDGPKSISPEAEGTVEDLEAELYGTHDVMDAIANGESYSPPDRATPEGYSGTRRAPESTGEDH